MPLEDLFTKEKKKLMSIEGLKEFSNFQNEAVIELFSETQMEKKRKIDDSSRANIEYAIRERYLIN